jgi:UDP-glucose 4-epimerase
MSAPIAMVTGAAGFIGRAVARALAGEFEVIAAGRGTDRPELARLDLPPELSLVVHCAGPSSVGRSMAAPFEDFTQTVPPFAALLEKLRTRPARLVLLSSGAVYGAADRLPTDEEAPPRPVSPYGVHKRICEELCASWGPSYAVVRLFSVYGPGMKKQLLWDACGKALRGDRRFMGTGDESRDWLHIDDAVALILAAARARETLIVNGGSGVGTSVRDVVTAVFSLLKAGAPEFCGGGRPGDPARYLADIGRARSLGWQPRIAVADGIAQYVQWFREQG